MKQNLAVKLWLAIPLTLVLTGLQLGCNKAQTATEPPPPEFRQGVGPRTWAKEQQNANAQPVPDERATNAIESEKKERGN